MIYLVVSLSLPHRTMEQKRTVLENGGVSNGYKNKSSQ